MESPARSAKNRFYVSAFADFESTVEKVFSRARTRTHSIVEFAKYDVSYSFGFVETIHIYAFCKHPRKLEVKSDGDNSDVAFDYPP